MGLEVCACVCVCVCVCVSGCVGGWVGVRPCDYDCFLLKVHLQRQKIVSSGVYFQSTVSHFGGYASFDSQKLLMKMVNRQSKTPLAEHLPLLVRYRHSLQMVLNFYYHSVISCLLIQITIFIFPLYRFLFVCSF